MSDVLRYSDLVGLPLVARGSGVSLGRIFDVWIDPERGTLLALHTTHNEAIAPVDLGDIKRGRWEVRDEDAPIDPEELIRVACFPRARRRLIGKRVVTEEGISLGRVEDFDLDRATLTLKNLHAVRRWAWWWVMSEYTVSRAQVVRINEKEVIVKSPYVPEEEALRLLAKTPVT